VRNPEYLGREALKVFSLFLEQAFRDEQGKVGVLVSDLLDLSVEVCFDVLPDREPVRHYDYESLGTGIVG
jgi:hypothetical protein